MSAYKKAFTLRVEENILEKIKVISDKNKRSINAQIEFLLEECINEYEKTNGAININNEK